jgi:thioredoxin-like negative regulator of GroEL
MDKITEIDNLSKTQRVVTMVGASWCGPCKLKKPIFLKYVGTINGTHLEFIDVDDEPEFKEIHKVETLPTFIAFEDGDEVSRFVGAKLTQAQLENFILGKKEE